MKDLLMKKAIFGILLSLLPISMAWATSPEDLAWLEKANRQYYCLEGKGLAQFNCMVSADMKRWGTGDEASNGSGSTDRMIPFTIDRYVFTAKADGSSTLDKAPSTLGLKGPDDANAIKQSEFLMHNVKVGLMFWAGLVMQPLFPADDMKTDDCTVMNEKGGFSVYEKGKDYTQGYYFDSKTALTRLINKGKNGNVTTFETRYRGTPKGLLMTHLSVSSQDKVIEYSFDYPKTGKFMIPNKLEVLYNGPEGNDIKFDYELTEFKTTP